MATAGSARLARAHASARPLPARTRSRGLPGSRAVARGLLTPNELRSSLWQRVVRDVYVHREVADTPATRLQALRLVTDVDHVAAGAQRPGLRRLATAPGLRPSRDTDLAPTTRTADRRRYAALSDAECAALPFGADELVVLDGITFTSPLRTCLDLDAEPRLVEAVVVVDAFLYAASSTRCLAVYCENRYRWPGIRGAAPPCPRRSPGRPANHACGCCSSSPASRSRWSTSPSSTRRVPTSPLPTFRSAGTDGPGSSTTGPTTTRHASMPPMSGARTGWWSRRASPCCATTSATSRPARAGWCSTRSPAPPAGATFLISIRGISSMPPRRLAW